MQTETRECPEAVNTAGLHLREQTFGVLPDSQRTFSSEVFGVLPTRIPNSSQHLIMHLIIQGIRTSHSEGNV